jgi:hypothetical protein
MSDSVFEYVENETAETADLYSFRIRKGRFKNVIFTYGKVRFFEDKETDQLKFNFNYTINQGNSRYKKDELQKMEKFKKFISEILTYILEQQLTNADIPTDPQESM